MKLRPIQLVCLALLLATLRLADPTALAPGDYALQAGYLNALLTKGHAVARSTTASQPIGRHTIPAPQPPAVTPSGNLSPAFRSTLNAPWTMPHPRSQSAALQSFTGFGRTLA